MCVHGNDGPCVYYYYYTFTRLENVQRTTRFGLRPCTHTSGGNGAAYILYNGPFWSVAVVEQGAAKHLGKTTWAIQDVRLVS